MMKKTILFLGIIFLIGFAIAQQTGTPNNPNLGTTTQTVCCEQTNTGAFCQNVQSSECKPGSRQVPTSCESTSYCKAGTCYDSTEGTCLDNTPQLVCNANGGVWSEEEPPQCALGCCVLGDQAAYVSLVRCKRLSSYLGLETNYDTSVGSELACIEKVQQQEVGACVYEFEFEKTCKFGTRAECNTQTGNASLVGGTFYAGKLCSAEELGTICGPTTQTTCVSGKDGVYFKDSCGNPANIYDASPGKAEDPLYWSDVISPADSCNPESANAGSSSCGNCNYLQGSICRSQDDAGGNPTYGDFMCANLNCRNTQNGNNYRHGESWCVYDDAGGFGESDNSAGSRFYKHICINGKEVLEQCEDFRAEECIEQKIGDFSQAACKVNRWQDCVNQQDQKSCENEDVRDCRWEEGTILQALSNSSEIRVTGTCFPENKPGFNFWEDTETSKICALASETCIVTFEKDVFGGNERITSGEECWDRNKDGVSDGWVKRKLEICGMLGDCGKGINWAGNEGYGGYSLFVDNEQVDQ